MTQRTSELQRGGLIDDRRGVRRTLGSDVRSSMSDSWRKGDCKPVSAGQVPIPRAILGNDQLLAEYLKERVSFEPKPMDPSDFALAHRLGLFGNPAVTFRDVGDYSRALGLRDGVLLANLLQAGHVLDMGAGMGGLALSLALAGHTNQTQIISADVAYANPKFTSTYFDNPDLTRFFNSARASRSHLPPGQTLDKLVHALEYFKRNSLACIAHHVPLPNDSLGAVIDLKGPAFCTDRYNVAPPEHYGYILGEYIRLVRTGGLIAVNTLQGGSYSRQASVGDHIVGNTWNFPYTIVAQSQVTHSNGSRSTDLNLFLRVGQKD